MVAGIVSFYRQVPFCHVEAGLRSFDLSSPFPEEMHRVVVGRLADLHFAPTDAARDNLCERASSCTSPHHGQHRYRCALGYGRAHGQSAARGLASIYMLMTLHRRDNFGEPRKTGLRSTANPPRAVSIPPSGLASASEPEHLRGSARVLLRHPRVLLAEPFGYRRFVEEMLRARIILSDSGGVQEEAPALGRPVLVLRETTERGEAIETGGAALIGTERDAVVDAVARLLEDDALYKRMATPSLPYGDGHAAERIISALEERYT